MKVLWLKFQWIAALMLMISLLSGCFKTNPVTPTRFYVLNPTQYEKSLIREENQLNSKSHKMLSLEIVSLHLPQYLEKPQIVTRKGENRLEMAEYHQWGGNLRKNMIRVIAQNMSQLLGTPNVAMAPFRPRTNTDFRIEVEVMKFEPDNRGQVKFSAQWRLLSGKDSSPLAIQITELESTIAESPLDFDHTISVMSDLLGDFCFIICKEILPHIPGSLIQ